MTALDDTHGGRREWCVDGAIDRLLDGDVDEQLRRRLLECVRSDEGGRDELVGRASAVHLLRDPVRTPDLSTEILHKVGRRRAFLPASLRRVVVGSRLAACLCLLVGVLVVSLSLRVRPDLFGFATEPSPVVTFSSTLSAEAVDSRRAAAQTVQQAGGIFLPVSDVVRSPLGVDGEFAVGPRSSGMMGGRPEDWTHGVPPTTPEDAARSGTETRQPLIWNPYVASEPGGGSVVDDEPLP